MQLLQHFKELTIHPKNAKELKGLILQLAIQGKLTQKWRAENPNVESASMLLEKIKSEKQQLIKEKKIKNERPLPAITEEEIPYGLPEGWQWCRMQDFCFLITDGAHHTPKYVDKGVPFLSVKNLSKGGIDFKNTKFIEQEMHEALIKRCNPEFEDILLTKIGTTGIAKVIDVEKDFSIFVSVALLKVAKKHLYPYFIEHCINSPLIKKQSAEGTEGVGNKNLVLRKIKAFIVPIPPLEEQKAIVKTVNQLFAEVEQLEQQTKARIKLKEYFVTSALQDLATKNTAEAWSFLQPHFQTFFTEKSAVKKLRETVLQLAVQGKLTQKWRASQKLSGQDVEPAAVLLEKIKAEKEQLIKDKKIKKEKPLPAITEDEIPYELPEGWEWCRLAEVCSYIQRGKSPKYSEDQVVPVISQKCVQWSGFDISRARFITKDSLDKYVKERFLQEGDLLWNSTGDGTIGRVILFPKTNYEKVGADSHVTVVRAFEKYVVDRYLWFFTSSPLIQNLVAGRVSGSTKQTELGTGTVKMMEFSLPPLEEQKAIVDKVNSLMALCDQLEQEIEHNTKQVEELMQSCLKEVFEN